MIEIIERAANRAGGSVALAAALGVQHQALCDWEQVPAEYVLRLEDLSGFSRHLIRPDLSRIFIEPLWAREWGP